MIRFCSLIQIHFIDSLERDVVFAIRSLTMYFIRPVGAISISGVIDRSRSLVDRNAEDLTGVLKLYG